jgi:hypothetical protein
MRVSGRCHCGAIAYEADCGSPVYSTSVDKPASYSLRVGALVTAFALAVTRVIVHPARVAFLQFPRKKASAM